MSTTGHIRPKFPFSSIKNVCFRTSLISGFQKRHLYFCAMPKNAENRNLKKGCHPRMRFLGYMFAKNRYINLKSGIPDVRPGFYNIIYVFLNFKIFVFCKKKNLVFFTFWVKITFLEYPTWLF